jgi:hypothetical protein
MIPRLTDHPARVQDPQAGDGDSQLFFSRGRCLLHPFTKSSRRCSASQKIWLVGARNSAFLNDIGCAQAFGGATSHNAWVSLLHTFPDRSMASLTFAPMERCWELPC